MRRGKNPIKTDPENGRISTHESYYIFKKLEERLNTLRRNMYDVKKKSQIKNLDMKTKCHR